MKVLPCILVVVLFFCGCGATSSELDSAMELRQKILTASCSFTTEVTADYGDEIYCFRMDCNTDTAGNMTFTVVEPASIAGITGEISTDFARLTFDGTVLSFPPLTEGKLSPVTAPWIFMKTLRSGYLSGCGKDGEGLRIFAADSYDDNALQLSILTDAATIPVQADIFWNQQRILTLQISDFVIL